MINKYEYYSNLYKNNIVTANPSSFSKSIVGLLSKERNLIDFGSGNLRDSNFLSHYVSNVICVDPSSDDRDRLYGNISIYSITASEFFKIPALIKNSDIYARFLIHTMSELELDEFMNLIIRLDKGSKIFFEYRYKHQLAERDHPERMFIDQNFIAKILSFGNLEIIYYEIGKFSPTINENPTLARLILEVA